MVEVERRRRSWRLSTVLAVIAVSAWTVAMLVRFIVYGSGQSPVPAITFALFGAVFVFFVTSWVVQGVVWLTRRWRK